MQAAVKKILDALGLRAMVRGLIQRGRTSVPLRTLLRKDARIVEAYRRSHAVRRLHVGCGDNLLDGWLNAGLPPWAPSILRLDATKRFPFEDGDFDFIFSEHMIEHLAYPHGAAMLSECFRTLKPGGRVRISTPDLAFVIGLYDSDKTERQRAYIDWSIRTFLPWAPGLQEAFVINNFVRDWGHRFIYDETTLRAALESAGFRAVTRCALQCSDVPALRGLENEGRMPAGFLELETLTLEGTKPGGPRA